ncbi:hypothetical protein KKJ06_20870 [Xenorhabdus bovienii]|uniref:hypothetical protein n=1 Tax=Xenorhabdus bovienii TaxID=40576 RepID=UPI0023B227B8|nr:hypothetical protein [Xenorhabdus bovienii]MDE9557793.1 hypothetical protein [Xenorhabdus bovienii]
MSLWGKILFFIWFWGLFCWVYWYISVPVGAFFVFMARRKKIKIGKIIYSICALFFLLPVMLFPIISIGFVLIMK